MVFAVVMLSSSAALAGNVRSASPWGAALNLHLGLGGQFSRDKDHGGDSDASPTMGVTPALEYRLGTTVSLGGEWMFAWIKEADYDGSRSKLWVPALRGRLSFPVTRELDLGAMLAVGLGILMPAKGDTEVALPAYHFGFGGAYRLNQAAQAYVDAGYMSASFMEDAFSYSSKFETFLITIGLVAGL